MKLNSNIWLGWIISCLENCAIVGTEGMRLEADVGLASPVLVISLSKNNQDDPDLFSFVCMIECWARIMLWSGLQQARDRCTPA